MSSQGTCPAAGPGTCALSENGVTAGVTASLGRSSSGSRGGPTERPVGGREDAEAGDPRPRWECAPQERPGGGAAGPAGLRRDRPACTWSLDLRPPELREQRSLTRAALGRGPEPRLTGDLPVAPGGLASAPPPFPGLSLFSGFVTHGVGARSTASSPRPSLAPPAEPRLLWLLSVTSCAHPSCPSARPEDLPHQTHGGHCPAPLGRGLGPAALRGHADASRIPGVHLALCPVPRAPTSPRRSAELCDLSPSPGRKGHARCAQARSALWFLLVSSLLPARLTGFGGSCPPGRGQPGPSRRPPALLPPASVQPSL